ncbi:hypothetical protein KM043_015507 [Ampulex compressa]|nr:hypothetical protein KM043_015507 [Ampulex compressa]
MPMHKNVNTIGERKKMHLMGHTRASFNIDAQRDPASSSSRITPGIPVHKVLKTGREKSTAKTVHEHRSMANLQPDPPSSTIELRISFRGALRASRGKDNLNTPRTPRRASTFNFAIGLIGRLRSRHEPRKKSRSARCEPGRDSSPGCPSRGPI